jgi:iron complex transport system substrate-binding protein
MRRLSIAALLALTLSACGDDPSDAGSDAGSTAPAPATTEAAAAPAGNPSGCLDDGAWTPGTDLFVDQVSVEHAKEWSVTYGENYKVVTVDTDTGPDVAEETYVLVQCGTPAPELSGELDAAFTIEVPIRTLWEGGGAVYGAIEDLGVADSVVGWVYPPDGVEFLPGLAARADQIAAVNYGESLEPIVEAAPSLYLQYEGPEALQRLRETGITAVHYSPFSEDPLGSAEQLKFLSLFYNLEAEANAAFDPIEARYLELQSQVADLDRPSVLLGSISEGEFVSRENDRIEAHLIRDGGGTVLLDETDLGPTIRDFTPISLESVLDVAADADFWFAMNYVPEEQTADEFIASDPLQGEFAAMPAGNAFHRFKRREDYFGTAAVHVDVLLEDMISILHPEVLPDHETVYLFRIPA